MAKRLYCSFCGKAEHEVFYIVEGPDTGICDECVILANDVIALQRARIAQGGPIRRGPREFRTFAEFREEANRRASSPPDDGSAG